MEKTQVYPLMVAMWRDVDGKKETNVALMTVEGRTEQSARRWVIHRVLETGWIVAGIRNMEAEVEE